MLLFVYEMLKCNPVITDRQGYAQKYLIENDISKKKETCQQLLILVQIKNPNGYKMELIVNVIQRKEKKVLIRTNIMHSLNVIKAYEK